MRRILLVAGDPAPFRRRDHGFLGSSDDAADTLTVEKLRDAFGSD